MIHYILVIVKYYFGVELQSLPMKIVDQKKAQNELRKAAFHYVRASDDLLRITQHIANGGEVSHERFRAAHKKLDTSAASLDMTALAYAITRFPKRKPKKKS
jgi:hypothetical protein